MFKEIIKYGELEAVYKEKEILSKKPRLTNLFWESTLRCNANCKHCGSRAGENINIKIENIKKIKKSNFNVILQVTTVTNKSNIKEPVSYTHLTLPTILLV